MKKKIAIFNDFQLPVPAVRGGAVQQLTTALLDCNELDYKYDFEVYAPYDEKAVELSKKYKHTVFHFSKLAKYIRFYTNVCHKLKLPVDLSSMPLPPDIFRIFKKTHYDTIYVSGYVRGVLTVAKINKNRCPVYYHHHVVTDILNEESIRGADIFKSCKKVGFVSQYACDKAKTGVEEYDEKIALFRNCIDTKKFHISNKDQIRSEIRKKYGIQDNEVVVVFVGRFVANKGVLQLLKAFKAACSEKNSLKLMLIGGETYSSNAKTEYVSSCLEIAESIKDKVIMTGFIPNDELPKIFAAGDIGCVPSVYEEACGLTALELMASGLPIITTGAGGLQEHIPLECKGVYKWEVGSETDAVIDGLKNLIIKYAKDEKLRTQQAELARINVSKYDICYYLNMFKSFID